MGHFFDPWVVYPMNRVIFYPMEHECAQYAVIPLFHYSNWE